MKPSQVKKLISSAFDAGHHPPLFIWGPPGVGKSSVVKQVAKEKGVGFLDLRLLLLDPTDLRGIPIPLNGETVWLRPRFLPKDGKGILNLDELNVAPPIVQNSALQLCLDHRVGEHEVGPEWFIVACGNREKEAFVYKMSPALLNRFVHVDYEVDQTEWQIWAACNNIRPEVMAYQRFKPDMLMNFDITRQEHAFPSPRSWEFTSHLLNSTPSDILSDAIAGAVGKGASIEFMAYMRVFQHLPDIDKIMAGENIIPPISKMDILCAVVASLVSRAQEQKHFNRCLEYSLLLPAELAVLLGKQLLGKNEKATISSKSWTAWAQKFVQVIA